MNDYLLGVFSGGVILWLLNDAWKRWQEKLAKARAQRERLEVAKARVERGWDELERWMEDMPDRVEAVICDEFANPQCEIRAINQEVFLTLLSESLTEQGQAILEKERQK